MAFKLVKDFVMLGGLGLGLIAGWTHRVDIYEALGISPATEEASVPVETLSSLHIEEVQINKGSVVTLPKNSRDGQYWADARVNSGHVKFLVDTGASSVALTLEDAKTAGVQIRNLQYNVPISTAGGKNYAAAVTLDTISIGGITLRNVKALVVPNGLHVSLLGMTFLGDLQKVEATPNALILRY